MSAEPRRVTNAEVWTDWENRIVNGVFPLRRFLGRSNHSAVFLTEYRAENLPEVAIKFVPADTLQTEVQLVQWGTAATLSHPHLVRIFDVGRCQFRGRGFLFVVMEYAEQTLAQILPKRALTPDEVRELLPPTLNALAFLHQNNLVQGQLKPSNFLVVNDQLKLASDTVRQIGTSPSGLARTSLYDPPELKDGTISAASDAWGLGLTLAEALTQRTPTWPEERTGTVSLPASFPEPFADTVRRCLNRTSANRPTLAELEALYNPEPPAPVIPVPQPPAREARREASSPRNPPQKRGLFPIVAATLVIALGVWVGLRLTRNQPDSFPATPDTSQADLPAPADTESASTEPADPELATSDSATPDSATAAAPTAATPAMSARATTPPAAPADAVGPAMPATSAHAAPTAAPTSSAAPTGAGAPPAPHPQDQPSLPQASTTLPVLHQVVPQVPEVINNKIRGHINVTVRVLVDPSGNVVGEFLENPGPSRYFARIAGDAAGEWKFVPADTQGPRVWKLRFEFTRDGATVESTAAQ